MDQLSLSKFSLNQEYILSFTWTWFWSQSVFEEIWYWTFENIDSPQSLPKWIGYKWKLYEEVNQNKNLITKFTILFLLDVSLIFSVISTDTFGNSNIETENNITQMKWKLPTKVLVFNTEIRVISLLTINQYKRNIK